MTFISILETLILGPLKLLFEYIFHIANTFVNHPGLSIIVLSLTINILVFPLYKRADEMQKEARNVEKKLRAGVEHIKKSFSGDEKMMMLQTYYRQNNYRPTDAFKGSVSLLLQIPFFMAAYGFLSNLQDLKGATLGPITDLGAPDGLLVISGVAINILPILMTLINFISSAIFLRGFPLKNKVQIYGMALAFLVLLYKAPAGLAFYWTLNNLFSLVKTIFYKIKNPQRILRILASLVGIAAVAFALFKFDGTNKKKIFLVAIGLLLQVGLFFPVIKKFFSKVRKPVTAQPDNKLFTAGCCFLSVLVGALISSTFIADSPQEFVDVSYFYHPLWYVVSSFCFAAGTFLVWLRVFYCLATPNLKVLFGKMVWVISGVMIVNYMFFGTNLGNISATLKYDADMAFTTAELLTNLAVIGVLCAILFFIVTKWKKATISVLLVATIAISVMTGVNVVTIKNSVDSITIEESSEMPSFQLDKNGKNVVVIMLDRAVGTYVPYIFNENKELKEQFDGFTHYANTISFGMKTNFGIPPLLGGYEYTPVEMNKRDTELLVEKHNEALLMMPVLFSENDYEVTVCDPTYANYSWIPDLSLFDDYPEINACITKDKFDTGEQKDQTIITNNRNFFCFSIMKCMPLAIQQNIYYDGTYRKTATMGVVDYNIQTVDSLSTANGFKRAFMRSYAVLNNMANMTEITENNKNTYLYLPNDLTHEPALLQAPEYVPTYEVDNTKYDAKNADRFTVNGKTIKVASTNQMTHYHSNMAAFVQIGNWLDYLRENDVYDNTKIIIAADHGQPLSSSNEYVFSDPDFQSLNTEGYYPLLMVKDFDSEGFTTSYEFMTNADVPTLATKDLISNPVNPFTGKPINSDEKYAHDQYVILSVDWQVDKNNGYSFFPAQWASVSDDLHNEENWDIYNKKVVLKEHKLP